MIFKMTLNDLEGVRSPSQNDLKDLLFTCIKFEVSIFIAVLKIFRKYCDGINK